MTEATLWKEANKLSPFHGYTDDWGEDRDPDVVRTTRQQAVTMTGVAMKEYWTPFDDYDNIEIDACWNDGTRDAEWRERKNKGAPHRHGLELERSKGYIAITEEQPIVAVSVLGSACKTDAYLICEYPQPGLTNKEPRRHGQEGFNMQNLRQQIVKGLHCQHPSRNIGTFGGDQMTYVDDFEPVTYETSARFEIEPTTTVIIRGGAGNISHFSFRMIRIYFRAE